MTAPLPSPVPLPSGALDVLVADIAAHSAYDATEAAMQARIVALIADTAAPTARHQFVPGHLTASAFVRSPDGGALLMIHHAKLLRWLQPGGHVEPGEVDLCLAAQREAAEETGLTDLVVENAGRPFDLDVHTIPPNPKKGEPAHEHFDVRFLFTATSDTPQAGSDATQARFVPLGEVAALNPEAGIRRVLHRLGAAQ